ncbi:hypothetical protein KGQ90_11960 [Modicisalibacter tunisiensis]|uniref:hypothetical protein n=1 Tax=Modicisalibacter tunisiensis TaxID=390637 RepID=UPI001CCA78DF|nr:hypothetical protein [Modicisalibacter tunisiensis]MBZ9539643.1 hypothetical protein [Modicisalibacter tunisiensis]
MCEFDNDSLSDSGMQGFLGCLNEYEVVTDSQNQERIVSSRHAWTRRLIEADNQLRALGKGNRYLYSETLT